MAGVSISREFDRADLFPIELNRLVRLLVDKVEIREDGMELALRGEGLGSVVGEITAIFEQANGRNPR